MKYDIQVHFKEDLDKQVSPRTLDTRIDTAKGESCQWNEHFLTAEIDDGKVIYTYPMNTISRIRTTPVGTQ